MIGFEGRTLRSERLMYRLLDEADKPALSALLADATVTEPAGFLPAGTAEEFDRFFATLTQYNTGIALFHGGQLIGYFHVNRYIPDEEAFAEKTCVGIGIVVGAAYQGQRFGTEALTCLTAYLLERFDAVFADCFRGNAASQRMVEKGGYRYCGEYTMFFDELGREMTCRSYVCEKGC